MLRVTIENLRPDIGWRFHYNNKNDKTYVLFLADFDGVDGHEEGDDEHHRHDKELNGVEALDEFAHVKEREEGHEAGQDGVDDLGGLSTIY